MLLGSTTAPELRSPHHEKQTNLSTAFQKFDRLPVAPIAAAKFPRVQDTSKQPCLPKEVGIMRKRKFGMDQPGISGTDEAESTQRTRESRCPYPGKGESPPNPQRPSKSNDWERFLEWLEILKSIPEIWERITAPVDTGDIFEVFWDSILNPIQICCSPSAGFQLVRNKWPQTYFTPIFTTLSTDLTSDKFYFDDELSILFFSPLMSTLNIENFTEWLGPKRDRFRRIALNHHILEGRLKDNSLDLKILARYRNLEELTIVSEVIEPGDPEPFGPTKTPPQTVDFIFADSNQPRALVPWDANDCRRVFEAKLQDVKDDDRNNPWPQYVKVDVVHIKRDGKLMKTEFGGPYQKDVWTKMKEAEEEAIVKAINEEEWNDECAFMNEPSDDDTNHDFDDESEADGEIEIGDGSDEEDPQLADDSS